MIPLPAGPSARSAAFLVAAGLFAVSTAGAATVPVLTYNVRGLPAFLIEDRDAEIADIAERLEDFHTPGGSFDGSASLVALQELFDENYYDTITDPQTISYPYVTPKNRGGRIDIGDGLTELSDFAYSDRFREDWRDCAGSLGSNGSDCDTDKGYSFAVYDLGGGAAVHVYNLHTDAGQDDGSRKARRDNIDQLVDAVNELSPAGTAVIVLGDTNSLYTRSGAEQDNIETLLGGTGVSDVWLHLLRDDMVPAPGDPIDDGCGLSPDGPDCERIDKIFYRSGATVTLTPLEYFVPDWAFLDEGGHDLSDHKPVAATFEVTVWPLCGDANADGVLTAADALLALQTVVGSAECEPARCDYSGDGEVLTADALAILGAAVGAPGEPACPKA